MKSVFLSLPALFAATSLLAKSVSAPSANPAQWTGEEVYQILNKSPWAQTVKVNLSSGDANAFGSQTPSGNNAPSNRQMPLNMGGGRRGGGRSGGSYSSGRAEASPSTLKTGATEVKIQWQSATVVQLAAAKKAGETADPASVKSPNEYIIAVIGLPVTAMGGRSASADSDATLGTEQAQRIAANVQGAASLERSGNPALTPTSVELDQGADGRTLIHFPKIDPITIDEKSVEFRLVIGHTKLRRKFELKDLEFAGKLDL